MVRLASLPLGILGLAFGLIAPARADEVPEKYQPAVNKGLAWLAKQQNRDGSWAVTNNQYPVAMTSLAGLAFLMEGSTPTQGKYKDPLRRASDWLVNRCQKGNAADGMIGNPNEPSEASRYMFGHGFAVLFLAAVYGDEDNRERRLVLKDVLTRAVKFTANAQSSTGGWFYTSKKDGHDQDEGATTLAQIQGLWAARQAGIPVPKDLLRKAHAYLAQNTGPQGGLYYSSGSKSERPMLTAGALACTLNTPDYDAAAVKKWLPYCQKSVPLPAQPVRIGYDEYGFFYFAQAVFLLGDHGYAKLLPNAKEKLQWTSFRRGLFDHLLKTQQADGSWPSGGGFSVGPVYTTSLNLVVLQLDNDVLPILSSRR